MGLFDDLKLTFRRSTRGDTESRYLNGSTSVVDLEMRQREIDQGRFRHLPYRGRSHE